MPGQSYRPLCGLFLLLVVSLPTLSRAESNPSDTTTSLDTIVNRLRAAADQSRARWSPYRLLREYRMFHEQNTAPMAEVKAEVTFDPGGRNSYQILESRGSDRGSHIVSKLLDGETTAWSKCGQPKQSSSISRENYDFSFLGVETLDGHKTYVIGLHPRRKETGLVEGKAWVDQETYLVRKIVGEEAKSPSWWIRNVALVLTFGPVGGMWMQTSSSATADIRVVGKYTMIGNAVGLETAEMARSSAAVRSSQ